MYTHEYPEKVKTVAFYRILYGCDFMKESLDSIYPYVDKIIIFHTNKVWKGIESVTYFGKQIYIPHAIDNILDIIKHYNDPENKINMFEDYYDSPANQITYLINNKIMTNYNVENIMYVECDEVWKQENIIRLLDKPKQNRRTLGYNISRIEFWKSHKYAFRYESWRQRLYVMNNGTVNRRKIGTTSCGGNEISNIINCPDCDLHHFAYASSPQTVFWKHITGLGFSPGVDSVPNEHWFEDVWLPWDFNTNRIKGLCPATGYEMNIPDVEPYPFDQLPEVLQEKYNGR